jgi:hypothetical protein
MHENIHVTDESISRMVNCGLRTQPAAAHRILEEAVTMDELLNAQRNGKTRKATGCDGISLQFFKQTWESSKEDLLACMKMGS